MEETIVFLDGGFISKLSKHFGEGQYLKFDLIKFAKNLAKKQNLFCKRIFYYNAPPFQPEPPTEEETKRKKGYDKFIRALSKNKNTIIREGRVQKLFDENKNPIFKQKGVDTLLTIDLSHIREDFSEIKKIMLVSSDTDFCPAIRDIKKRANIEVILYTYFDKKRKSKFSLSNKLISCCSQFFQLIKQDFDQASLKQKKKEEK